MTVAGRAAVAPRGGRHGDEDVHRTPALFYGPRGQGGRTFTPVVLSRPYQPPRSPFRGKVFHFFGETPSVVVAGAVCGTFLTPSR